MLSPLIGGILIGISATLLLTLNGRIAGISGILGSALAPGAYAEERAWRIAFLIGLVLAGALLHFIAPDAFGSMPGGSLLRAAAAGALVGYGTRLGSGCTSGHGVCGISRLSARSFVATATFILFGALTVFLTKQIGGDP